MSDNLVTDNRIRFEYKGAIYFVDVNAAELNKIVLPNKVVLEADSWTDSTPPAPVGLKEIDHAHHDLAVQGIAFLLTAVVATSR